MPTIERQLLLAKAEGTYGADPTLATTDAILVYEPTYKLASSLYKRGTASNLQRPMRVSQVGKRMPSLSFWQELRGNSTALAAGVKPVTHDLWQACGFIGAFSAVGNAHWTYTYDAAASTSLYFRLESHGLNQLMAGARGNFDLELIPGERAKLSYQFEGLYVAHEATDMVVPVYVDTPPLLVTGCAFTPFGDNPGVGDYGRVTKVNLACRNQVYRCQDVNAAEGCSSVEILGRGTPPDDMGSQVTLEITRPGDGDDANWLDRFINRTEAAACTITLGSQTLGAKQTCVINFGRLVVDAIEDIKIGSLYGHKVTCQIMGTDGGTTEDDLSIRWDQYT